VHLSFDSIAYEESIESEFSEVIWRTSLITNACREHIVLVLIECSPIGYLIGDHLSLIRGLLRINERMLSSRKQSLEGLRGMLEDRSINPVPEMTNAVQFLERR